jgi:hypothetical protein
VRAEVRVVVVGAAGAVVHTSFVMSGFHFVETKLAPPVALQTPTTSSTGVPAQAACGKNSSEPPQVAEAIVHPQGGHTTATPAPTTCLSGVPAGQATSPGDAMHAFIDGGTPHARSLHDDAWSEHTRRACVTTFAGTADAADVQVPTTAVGASTRAF